jgi:hypothetical protein
MYTYIHTAYKQIRTACYLAEDISSVPKLERVHSNFFPSKLLTSSCGYVKIIVDVDFEARSVILRWNGW